MCGMRFQNVSWKVGGPKYIGTVLIYTLSLLKNLPDLESLRSLTFQLSLRKRIPHILSAASGKNCTHPYYPVAHWGMVLPCTSYSHLRYLRTDTALWCPLTRLLPKKS